MRFIPAGRWKTGEALFPGIALLILATTLISTGCKPETQSRVEDIPVPVEVLVVSPVLASEETILTGVLEAHLAADVICETGGEVETIHREIGDPVTRNGLLASVEKLVPQQTLNQAEAVLMATEARIEIARDDYQRDSTLFAHGDISTEAWKNSRLMLTTAEADLMSAKAGRKLAARTLREADIRSPFDGHVSRRYCETGEYITPGTPAFRVVDIDYLRLRLGVSQQNVASLHPGMEVTITSDALGDTEFTGRVQAVSPEADDVTKTFMVEAVFTNPEGRPLRDGLIVRAALALTPHKNVLTVPREAVLHRSGEALLFVITDSKAEERIVRLGPIVDGYYIIENGLAPGDRVVIVGMQNLDDGTDTLIETEHNQMKTNREVSR